MVHNSADGLTYTTDRNVFGQDITVNGITVGVGNVDNNTILGKYALSDNTTGSNNTAVGKFSQQLNTEGIGNTSIGSVSLYNNKVGIDNTAIGYNSLYGTNGSENTALGRDAGNLLSSGGNNLILGAGAQASSPTVSNEVTIGNNAVTTVRMGNGDLIYPMSSPILYTSILGTQADLPDGVTVSLPFVGTGWSGDAFIAPKTGIYFLDASFQWSLINPTSNQIYRNAYLGKNSNPSFFQTSMAVNCSIPLWLNQ